MCIVAARRQGDQPRFKAGRGGGAGAGQRVRQGRPGAKSDAAGIGMSPACKPGFSRPWKASGLGDEHGDDSTRQRDKHNVE